MFHSSDGWTWERLEHGMVRVRHHNEIMMDIAAESWASIISSVSKGGESDYRFYAALDFHNSQGCIEIAPKDLSQVKGNY